MKDKFKIIGILVLAGFSFFYTNEVSKIIKKNDPIMKQISNIKDDMAVSKIEGISINNEYITGINGCVIDEVDSYNNMKNVGEYKEELLVMKEDKLEEKKNVYIIGGNTKKRNVGIILLNYNKSLNEWIDNQKIKINYFLDGNYILENVENLINSKNSNIFNGGRNHMYNSKYLVYDNTIISTNFKNSSSYCLFNEKNDESLKLCTSYKMKSIKSEYINNNILNYTRDNLKNGKIFVFDITDINQIKTTIKYIQSKGYNIVLLDELLDESNSCK